MKIDYRNPLAFFGVLAVMGLLVLGFLEYPPQAKALDKPLGALKTATTTCSTTATELASGTPGKRSFTVINTSATAVYVGGSDVDGSTAGTTGIAVCDGCTAGKTFAVDARRGWCVGIVGCGKPRGACPRRRGAEVPTHRPGCGGSRCWPRLRR